MRCDAISHANSVIEPGDDDDDGDGIDTFAPSGRWLVVLFWRRTLWGRLAIRRVALVVVAMGPALRKLVSKTVSPHCGSRSANTGRAGS